MITTMSSSNVTPLRWPVVAVTRLRLRSLWLFPGFFWHSFWALYQANKADGCVAVDAQRESDLVFWTRTVSRDEVAMRAFVRSGAHKKAMPKVLHWCDEASVVHWLGRSGQLPDWIVAEDRLRRDGRVLRVLHPSDAHARGETVPGREDAAQAVRR